MEHFEDLWCEIELLKQEKEELWFELERTKRWLHGEIDRCLGLITMGQVDAAVNWMQHLSKITEVWE